MRITIIGLDADYEDCAQEMGARIYPHDGVIDCQFPEHINICSNHASTISIMDDLTDVGMVIDATEFFTITID